MSKWPHWGVLLSAALSGKVITGLICGLAFPWLVKKHASAGTGHQKGDTDFSVTLWHVLGDGLNNDEDISIGDWCDGAWNTHKYERFEATLIPFWRARGKSRKVDEEKLDAFCGSYPTTSAFIIVGIVASLASSIVSIIAFFRAPKLLSAVGLGLAVAASGCTLLALVVGASAKGEFDRCCRLRLDDDDVETFGSEELQHSTGFYMILISLFVSLVAAAFGFVAFVVNCRREKDWDDLDEKQHPKEKKEEQHPTAETVVIGQPSSQLDDLAEQQHPTAETVAMGQPFSQC